MATIPCILSLVFRFSEFQGLKLLLHSDFSPFHPTLAEIQLALAACERHLTALIIIDFKHPQKFNVS